MLYEVGNMCINHPVSGALVRPGEQFTCKQSELRPRWNDADWLLRAEIPWIVRPVEAARPARKRRKLKAAAPIVAAEPLPVVVSGDDSSDDSSGTEGGTLSIKG